jgi:polyhydroxyalkanoate synthesis regulator phasin
VRREPIWNWPTVGDHVHVEGFWIFDRGHPPASSEIHPPRLVAIQRQLPAIFGPSNSLDRFVLATKTDVYASGDGGALDNNRSGAPSFVRRVPINEKDYTFRIAHKVPPPSSSARLNAAFVLHDGDNFPGNPTITQDRETRPDGSVHLLPSVTVTIPWNTLAAPDTALFARTFYVWWSTGDSTADLTVNHGAQADYHPRLFKVTPDYVIMNSGANDMLEPGIGQGDMELRMFVEVGGTWLSVNEMASDDVDNILQDGLGDAGDDTTDGTIIDRRGGGVAPWQFTLVLPPGGNLRVHADGWEADGINGVFGHLIDPNAACDCTFEDEFNNLFGVGTYLSGGRDDPLGEVNHILSCQNADTELGATHTAFLRDQSGGGVWNDDITGDNVDQNRVFQFQFNVQELAWPGAGGIVPPGGPCDTFPPDITITQPTATQYVHSDTFTLGYSAVDVGGAGLKDLSALMDGLPTLAGHGLDNGQLIRLLTEMKVGQHTFTVLADDYLGNAGSASVTFEIIVTAESIQDDVRQFVASGQITQDEGNSLLKKLVSAAKARAKGNCANAATIYASFISEVQAQSGKKIDPVAASILIDDAQYLIAHCP